ncbi:MAG: neuraminidase-like domain-containing protein [Vicinamibacterales bacterium]
MRELLQGARDSLATLGDGLDTVALAARLDDVLAALAQAPLVQATIAASLDALRAELTTLAAHFVDHTLRPQLTNGLAAALGVGAGVTSTLLARVLVPADPSRQAGEVLLEALRPLLQGVQPTVSAADLRELMYRLVKAARIVNALAISDDELTRLCDAPASRGWLNLTALPVKAADPAASLDAWMRLASLVELRQALPEDQRGNLFSLFDIAAQFQPGAGVQPGAARLSYIATLKSLTGSDSLDIDALVGRFDQAVMPDGGGGVLKPAFPAHFVDERLPLRVLAGRRLGQRIGVAAIECSGWLAPSPVTPESRLERIKNALRARFGDHWPGVQKTLRDPLRERQRRALVAYLVHTWHLDRADDLFDHFLIDVEMSPCMMTSRLIQATAAVQLLVQRVLLNLEPGLMLADDAAEQWEWMKNYRVWEANRKIFLYPENWIEPDLRDDKTPFFTDLERELRQSRITNDTAEAALLHYLQKLHEVARLQVCGQFLDAGIPTSTVHVFARTRETPHHYYYRRGLLEVDLGGLSKGGANDSSLDARWTPWERVDLDIEGDHLIPVVYNRRVYLFWPIFLSEDEAPMAHTLQSLLSVYGQMFKLLQAVGSLVESVFKGIGISVIAAAANGIIEILWGLQQAFPIELRDMRNAVRDIRTALLGLFGVTASSDNTLDIVGQAAMPNIGAIGEVFQNVLALVSNYEQYLLSFLPAKLLKVQLAWSEYRGDNWTAKRTSNGAVSFRDLLSLLFENLPDLPGLSRDGVRRLFTFRASVAHGDLIIHCGIAMPDSLLNPQTLQVLGQSTVTALTDDDPTTNRPAWLSAPLEIGFFRVNTCAGEVDALDTSETIGFASLFGQVLDAMLGAGGDALEAFRQDRQLTQAGAPVTPDDDPDRPSPFRWQLDQAPLPQHFRAPYAPQDQDTYRILALHQTTSITSKMFGFFYHDANRTFYCFPWSTSAGKSGFVFFPFYHPYTCALIEQLQRAGIPGIYEDRYVIAPNGHLLPAMGQAGQPLQLVLKDDDYFRAPEYQPDGVVYRDPAGPRALLPVEDITFSSIAAYADYNWEVFFHVPLLIATRLSADQQFREAQRWFHYIFNPTDASRGGVPEKYWRTRPFVETQPAAYAAQDIDGLLLLLDSEAAQPGLQELEWAVRKWRRDAFNPHLIARTRTVAFQKTVVMKYIDNLVAWGDSLFRQETRESVNEALQLYVLAAKLLGPPPRRIPRSAGRPEKTYRDLEPSLDAFSNALVQFENYQQSAGHPGGVFQVDRAARDRVVGLPVYDAWRQLVKSPSMQNVASGGEALYFCVPPNEQLLGKWDLVADRLFKIRHCLNIEGRALQLPLLSPPLDPGVLVRAKAMGVELDELFGDLYGPPARYRFAVVLQKAVELCSEVKTLGAALLSAMEKRDGETLALLRNTHEARVLAAVRTVKELQHEEAGRAIEALQRSHESAGIRVQHYQRLLGEFVNPEEAVHLLLGMVSLQLQSMQFGAKMASAAASLIPNFKGGFVTTLGAMFGGDNIGFAAERASDGLGHLAALLQSVGGIVQTMGGYRRRAEDWLLQVQLAGKEQQGLSKQIAGAELRRDIAKADLENHQLQVANNAELQDTMQAKFSNYDLYDWMVAKVSALHFQAYQMAYEMARQAERSFVAELGGPEPGTIRADSWDSLKRGLLAGEHLHQDLKRLEVAYLARNIRQYEMTKHVSVSSVNPLALLELRATGRCMISLPESLFDMDGPGHYFRRVKSVAVSMPCVVGPYTSVNCTLTLLRSGVRTSSLVSGPYAPQAADRDEYQSIVTSSAQNDSGLLETNLRDERYLPFENAGVISEWRLELPANPSLGEPRQFDYETISDVVLHIRYTARDGGAALRKAAADYLKAQIDAAAAAGCLRLFSARHDFPTEWARFKAAAPAAGQRAELTLPMRSEHYPFWSVGRLNNVKNVALIVKAPAAGQPIKVYDRAAKADPNSRAESMTAAAFGGLLQAPFSDAAPGMPRPASPVGDVKLYFDDNAATEMWLAVTWSGA